MSTDFPPTEVLMDPDQLRLRDWVGHPGLYTARITPAFLDVFDRFVSAMEFRTQAISWISYAAVAFNAAQVATAAADKAFDEAQAAAEEAGRARDVAQIMTKAADRAYGGARIAVEEADKAFITARIAAVEAEADFQRAARQEMM